MEKDEVISLLNKALQFEYRDIFLYPREAERLAEIIKEKEIPEQFERFGRMELRHADNLAMQIQLLGGKAEWDFAPLIAKESIEEILLEHQQNEKKSIQSYSKILKLIDKEGQEQLKLVLKGIMSEEEGHLLAINRLTSRIHKLIHG